MAGLVNFFFHTLIGTLPYEELYYKGSAISIHHDEIVLSLEQIAQQYNNIKESKKHQLQLFCSISHYTQ